ncbi:MAG: leucine-rich repeat protein [Paludibacteraceae bacterium]|nr:leucine-rich repeat protein [Paludibacteraceae bacterium]
MKNVVNYILSAQKKIFLLAFLAVFSSFYTMVWGATSYTLTGTSSNKTLTITGTGAMPNYTSGKAPWYKDERSNIKHIVISDGVTSVGNYAFEEICPSGSSATVDVTIPVSCTSFGSNAFDGCTKMTKIYYAGSPSDWADITFSNQTAHPFGALTSSQEYFFYGETSTRTKTIVLTPTITEIKPYAFQRGWFDGNGIYIPGTVSSIGTHAFYGLNLSGGVWINRETAPGLGTDAFYFGGKKNLCVPAGATGYNTSAWTASGKFNTPTTQKIGEDDFVNTETTIKWSLDENCVLTINATSGPKSLTFNLAGDAHPWGKFRRLVYKIKVQGEITDLGDLLRYHYNLSEVIVDQNTIPTCSGKIAAPSASGTSYSSLFNQRDTLTLTITDPASRFDDSWSNLSNDPWDHSKWEIVYPTTTVTLSKDTETNGTFTLDPSSSVNTTNAAQTVTVTCVPSAGYATSSVSATEPDVISPDDVITYGGSGNSRTVTFPQYTHGNSTISVEFECATPTFSSNLSTVEVDYEQNDEATALSVTASANSGSLSYQWQSSSDNSSWSDIDGADVASFTPPTTETGTRYYHCIVTNTTDDCEEFETSNAAQITVTAPSPSAWSLHYGTEGQSDWTTVDFSQVESTNEWQIEDFVIPNKPNWYVDNAAGNDAKKKLSTWGDLYFAASQEDGTRPMVGNAVGAVGTVRIYDNSSWNNRYAGFIPNGYVLKIGSNEYSFASEDGNEYRSEIIEYSGSNARDNVSVGIVDENGGFVSTNNTSEMQHIFLNTGGTDLWSKDGVTNFGLYDDTEGHKYFTCLMTVVPGENYLYEGWVPSNCTKVIFCRLKSSTLDWGTDNNNVHNYTNSLVLQDNQNLWTVTGWDGGDGSWSAYTQKGRFCIWQNSTVKNWGVCFRPCYEFNATENANWNNANNWKPQSVPTIDIDVFLNKTGDRQYHSCSGEKCRHQPNNRQQRTIGC